MLKRLLLACSTLMVIGALAACSPAPAPAPAPPPQDTAADEAKMKADAMAWFDHFAKGDAEAVANLYAEDALLMPPGAPAVSGRAAIKGFFTNEIAGVKAAGLSLKNGAVTGAGVHGDLGWISGTYTVVDAKGATIDSGNYMSIHKRVNGAWPYIRDTWNSDRPVTPPPAPAKK